MDGDMRFNRSVSDELMDLLKNGAGATLVKRATGQGAEPLYDLQLRAEAQGTDTWATLYYGMTALINLRERKGQFQLTADRKYMALDSFDQDWTPWQPRASIEDAWPRVETYLAEIARQVAVGPALKKEGPVHAAIASGNSDAYRVIQREARPSFTNKQILKHHLAEWVAPFNSALAKRSNPEPWWPHDEKVGSSPDFLAVDIGGRLALIEAKADKASAREIAKVAVQAGVYASMFVDLFEENRSHVLVAVAQMLQQRAALGLSRKGVLHLRERGQVVPVVAIGPSLPSKEAQRRMWEVARAVSGVPDRRVDPIEVWYLDRAGRINQVERWEDVERTERL